MQAIPPKPPFSNQTISRLLSSTLNRPQQQFLSAASSFQLPSCLRNTQGMTSKIPAAKMRCDKRLRLAAGFANKSRCQHVALVCGNWTVTLQLTFHNLVFFPRSHERLGLCIKYRGVSDVGSNELGVLIREHPPRVFHVQPDASRMEPRNKFQGVSANVVTNMVAELQAQIEEECLELIQSPRLLQILQKGGLGPPLTRPIRQQSRGIIKMG